MTTGTPSGSDRGARILVESALAIKAAVNLPLQGQCEPPGDAKWFTRMKEAGIDALGMHLEAVTPEVRARIMPGKAQVSVEQYLEAFADAVAVFGRGQVSTYILAGLGDTPEAILSLSQTLIGLGRLSVRRALCADQRYAAGAPSGAGQPVYVLDFTTSGPDAEPGAFALQRYQSRLRPLRRLLVALQL